MKTNYEKNCVNFFNFLTKHNFVYEYLQQQKCPKLLYLFTIRINAYTH